ncbi:MAG: mucoidy inhibitor MuiA family protein, partial [Rhabdaerophilum calidifontis]
MPQPLMSGFPARFRPAARLWLAAGVSCAALAGAEAAQIEAASRVGAVTLHPDSAIVRRDLSVELPAGTHEIIVDGLPGTLDPASLRVEGAGDQRVVVTAIDLRARPAAEHEKPETQRRLKALRAERDRLADRADAVEGRKAMIQRFGQGGEGREGKPLEIEHWNRAWEAVGKGLQAANEELRGLRDEIQRVEAEIAALEPPVAQPRPGRAEPHRVAAIAVEAGASGRVTLSMSYRVQGAGWRPVYDARLDTRGALPVLELVRRAMIRQNTGEDWGDVALTLSTLQIARATAAPLLRGERVAFHEPLPPRPAAPMAVGRAAPGQADLAMPEAAPRQAAAPVEEAGARLDAGADPSSDAV